MGIQVACKQIKKTCLIQCRVQARTTIEYEIQNGDSFAEIEIWC